MKSVKSIPNPRIKNKHDFIVIDIAFLNDYCLVSYSSIIVLESVIL